MYAHSATPAVSPKMREVDPEALALRGDVLPGQARRTEAESGLDGPDGVGGVADHGVVCGLVVGEELKPSPQLLLTQGGRT